MTDDFVASIGRNINHRLLMLERVAQNCAIASRTVEKIVLPTSDNGQPAPALRWGDPRTVALSAAPGFAATARSTAPLLRTDSPLETCLIRLDSDPVRHLVHRSRASTRVY